MKILSIGADTPGAVAPKPKVQSTDNSAPDSLAAPNVSAGDMVTNSAAKSTEKPQEPAANVSTTESREAKREVDAVVQEQAAQVDEELLEEVYGKEHVNLIFIGHVDAGKSTLGGSILYATGMVDERTMEKYRRESKEAGRSTSGTYTALQFPFET